MTAHLNLRPYQEEAIDAAFKAWADGVDAPAVVLPTGAGKTVIFAHLIQRWTHSMGTRVMVLVHRDELADQAINKIRSVAPELQVGKVKAESDEVLADVLVCSVQTLASTDRTGRVQVSEGPAGRIGLVITDECHHAAAPTYQKIFAAFPGARRLGVTATLARGDNNGLGDVWDEVVYSKSVLWMISQGFLTDVKATQVKMDFNLSGVKTSRGDYQVADLGKMMEDAHADEAIAKAYKEHAGERPGVVFTPTVATAEAAAEALSASGIRTAVVTGTTPREERLKIFEDFRTGAVQVLSNCMVLTEGFDAPWASCAVIARPTQSNPLYIQMVGRVLRPWPGKTDALVLDLVGASSTNKLRTLVDLEPTFHGEIKEGETLAEAVEREADATGVPLPGSVGFELKAKSADLFAGSKSAWCLTPGGVMFIECGDTTVFLWPTKEGNFTVCTASKGARGWNKTQYAGLDIGAAMAWGEAVAEDHGLFSVQKNARWRKSKPSEAQLGLAQRLGIDTEGMNRGDVSAAVATVFAAKRFDPYVGRTYC